MRLGTTSSLALAVLVGFVVSSCAARSYSLATPNLVPPKLVQRAAPAYTDRARQAGVSGDVELLVRIGADGKPDHIRVTKSLDKVHGLDDEAVSTVRRFVFTPATLNGQAVAVEDVPIALSFRTY